MNSHQQTDVVIIGAGPVGLSLAIELGQRGIRCLLVEQNEGVGNNPRAKTTNVRTREHLRRWGIADNLRRASTLSPDYPSDIIFVTRLNGPQLTKIENAFNCAPDHNDLYSESAQWVPQYILEEVLRAHAVTLPSVDIRFNTVYVTAEQSDDGVKTILQNTLSGQEEPIHSAYLVGADGSRSLVRQTIGATLEGKRGTAENFNVQFRSAELGKLNPHGPAIMYWLINGDAPSLIGPMESPDIWYFIATRYDGNLSDIDPKALIRRATNLDFDMEILGSAPWAAHSLIADKYSDGRIFLAGDACHLHPPFGGYGMNMGIADGVDLGWKLAAVLQGWGGLALLASYEQERKPIHNWIVDEANANYAALGNHLTLPGLEAAGPVGEATRREVGDVIFTAKLREFKTLGAVLGYRYESAVIVADGTEPPAMTNTIYRPSGYPGCLAPHLWLDDGTSLYDHFGPGFTLLATGEQAHQNELREALAVADALAIPLRPVVPNDYRLRRRYGANFALIRPDQHVAWRGDVLPEDFGALLEQISGSRVANRFIIA